MNNKPSVLWRWRFWMSLSLPVLIVAIVFMASAFSNIHKKTYSLEKYGTAPETIYSPITIENEKETDRQMREALQSVEDRYSVSKTITEERIEKVDEIFEVVKEVGRDKEPQENFMDQTSEIQSLISEDLAESLPVELFRPLLSAEEAELNEAREMLVSALRGSFEGGIRSTDLAGQKRSLELKIEYSSIPESLQQVVTDIGSYALVENALYDAGETDAARKEAISNVDPNMIRSGEVIVEEGATISSDIYDELMLTGLLDEKKNLLPLLGLGVLTVLLALVFYYETSRAVKADELNRQHVYVLTAISIFMILMMKGFGLFVTVGQPLYYCMPVATGVMLIKLLCHERMAIVMSLIYAVMAMVLMNGQLSGPVNGTAGAYILVTQLAAIFFLIQTKDRLSIIRASSAVAVTNICMVLFFLFVSFEKYSWVDVFIYSGYGLAGAFIAGVLTLGLLPFIETWFGILSDNKLLTLASPNQPLLRKLLMEAPGTYHHSIMVANLSEAACESIGANGLLARVGAYYHDLGKTKEPHYFIENQMKMRNPHDFLDPEQSADIIIRHPEEGAKLLEKEKLPKEIIDIAKQHHGTTLLKYFYYQAQEERAHVSEGDYRYPGPKPQSKEAAVVCVCDSVEAAVRSLGEPTEEKIKKIVHSIIEDRLLDGQFDESDLTFKEVNQMEHAICETLQGIFHSRIQYPEAKTVVKEAK
ncbi:HDIG domain-containing protein [Halobacillus litoralis]|uniref:HD family phosphohydrolase n=1 Tax=Halobacillus litoralis TaxID=45668 RepID=UPI001CD3CF2B|nr:HDIG domain-containing metalloprotein [Halobacillus litoralis]MCA0970042.1 HDIG domain-containing protein [Halobacillus litoralis]